MPGRPVSDDLISEDVPRSPLPEHPAAPRLRERFEKEVLDVVTAQGQTTVVCEKGGITEVLTFLRDEPDLRFDRLSDVTAVDYQDHPGRDPHDSRFDVVYSLYSHPHNHRLRVRAPVADEDPRIASATSVWRGAEWPEREAFDMFGIRFDGHPDLRRILMPQSFEDFPLRKDYPLRGKGEREAVFGDPDSQPESEAIREDGDASASPDWTALDLGPLHPATNGTLRLQLQMEDGRVARCVPEIGYMHSGLEKMGETHSFDQFVVVADRMNHQSPLCGNIAYCASVEHLIGLDVPERATVVRLILWELSRIADHMAWLGTHAGSIGADTVPYYAFEQRERCYNIFELIAGARLTTSYARIGGLALDVPENFREVILDFVAQFPGAVEEVERLLTRNRVWIDRTKDIGVISGEDAIGWNMTGPMLRGSGVEYDIRKTEPFLNYTEYDFDIPVGENGDTYDRYLVRLEELNQSVRIISQAIEDLPGGPVKARGSVDMAGADLNPPIGDSCLPTESPNGELGFFVVSNGSDCAHRMRVRSPSFMNLQSLPSVVEGMMLSDAIAVLGSYNTVGGELDR